MNLKEMEQRKAAIEAEMKQAVLKAEQAATKAEQAKARFEDYAQRFSTAARRKEFHRERVYGCALMEVIRQWPPEKALDLAEAIFRQISPRDEEEIGRNLAELLREGKRTWEAAPALQTTDSTDTERMSQ